jgi:hypothetical protein
VAVEQFRHRTALPLLGLPHKLFVGNHCMPAFCTLLPPQGQKVHGRAGLPRWHDQMTPCPVRSSGTTAAEARIRNEPEGLQREAGIAASHPGAGPRAHPL